MVGGPTRGAAAGEDVGDVREAGEALAPGDVLVARGDEEVHPA